MNTPVKVGEHYILDLSGCHPEALRDADQVFARFSQAVRDSGLTVVDEGSYKFSPHGFTCFLLLAESHVSLHTWPEYNYCAIDLFTCAIGKDMTPLIESLKEMFGAQVVTLRRVDREAMVEEVVPLACSIQ